jgi:predicted permease
MFDSLLVDLRHSLRRLRRSPFLSAVVIATIALVMAANTTSFTMVKRTMLDSPAVPAPGELMAISFLDQKSNQPGYAYAETFAAFTREQSSFSLLSLYNGTGVLRVEAEGVSVDVGLEAVSPAYFELLRIPLSAGRAFTDQDGTAMLAVISERLANRIFGSAAAAVDRTIGINGRRLTVAGVTAAWFAGLQLDSGIDLLLPIAILRDVNFSALPVRAPTVIAGVKAGVGIAQARAEVLARWPAVQAATIGALPAPLRAVLETQTIRVTSLWNGFSGLRQLYGPSLQALMALGVVLLMIGCVNLAGLMLARGLLREQEYAVQLAVGASRGRVVGQSMLDGVLLAVCGLAIALPLAWWAGLTVESMMRARALPMRRHLTPDLQIVLLAAVTSIGTGIVVGGWSARRVLAIGAGDVLRRVRSGRGIGRSGRFGLMTQVALSMALVTAAGLFAATLASLYANDTQPRSHPIVWTRIARNSFERGKPIDQAYFEELARQVASLPGASGAAYSYLYPAGLGFPTPLAQDRISDDRIADETGAVRGLTEIVSPGFFEMFGIARLRGRDFAWSDGASAPPVAIVNRALASMLFPSEEAIGRRVRVSYATGTVNAEIVGVVANSPIGRLHEPDAPVVFRPLAQELSRAQVPGLHVRVSGDVAAVSDGYTRVVNASRYHFVRALFTIDGWIADALLQQRLVAGTSSAAAMLAVMLACVGIFASLAYSVASRVREIGIRMSIGATPWSVVQMVVRESAAIVFPGVLIGIPLALGVGVASRALLYGVVATDLRVLAAAASVFVAAGALAAFVPALRASRIQPAEALRQE